MLEDIKIYFNPGDVVKVKHFENSPKMYVVEKVVKSIINNTKNTSETAFIGIRCRWFDNNNSLCENIFSTKDLIHV